jgi:hypothetical protein
MQRTKRNTEVDFKKIDALPENGNIRNNRDTGGGNLDRNGNSALREAQRAWDALRSVGQTTFGVTLLNDRNKQSDFSENIDLLAEMPDARTFLESALEQNERQRVSFIVRPHGKNPVIQIDDCDFWRAKELLPYSFLAFETSHENYQVWLALHPSVTEDERHATRRRLLRKLGGDVEASGAMRFPGSINWKPGRNAFRVRLIHTANGRFTSITELERAGLLAVEAIRQPTVSTSGFKHKFPDYKRCLADKGYDRSKADASFLWICKARGFSRGESEKALYAVSEKAQQSGRHYVDRTLDFVFRVDA